MTTPLGLFAEEVRPGRPVPFHVSDEGLRPGNLSSGGVGARAACAAPQDAQSAELSAPSGRAPLGASGRPFGSSARRCWRVRGVANEAKRGRVCDRGSWASFLGSPSRELHPGASHSSPRR
eukprot:4154333-Alexandrium_andersonii.AAC.1